VISESTNLPERIGPTAGHHYRKKPEENGLTSHRCNNQKQYRLLTDQHEAFPFSDSLILLLTPANGLIWPDHPTAAGQWIDIFRNSRRFNGKWSHLVLLSWPTDLMALLLWKRWVEIQKRQAGCIYCLT
jgi:hypothetical protein